jgi:hypothetical protein
LREHIVGIEDDWKKRSRKLVTERVSDRFEGVYEDKLTSTLELERLYKEIRVIKNTHEIEMTKLVEENKRLKKYNEQSENLQ